MTLLNFFYATNTQRQKWYYEFVVLQDKKVLCMGSREAIGIANFIIETGRQYARKGVNEPVNVEQEPNITINIPDKNAYKTLPNKNKDIIKE